MAYGIIILGILPDIRHFLITSQNIKLVKGRCLTNFQADCLFLLILLFLLSISPISRCSTILHNISLLESPTR